jgi:succinoglycan biosynthesis protein ExoU
VADNLVQVKEGIEQVHQSSLLEVSGKPWQIDLEEFVRGDVGRRGSLRKELGFLKPIIRRSFLDHHRLRYDELLWLGEDYAFYARALALGARFFIIPKCGYVSVERPDSLSVRHTRQHLERLRDFDEELGKSKMLTVAERRAIRRHHDSVDARVQWIAIVDAVKARSVPRFAGPFFRSSTVTLFLLENLIEQVAFRTSRWLSKPYDVCIKRRSKT